MKKLETCLLVAGMAASLILVSAARAQAPASPPSGQVASSVDVTATVTKIDQKTREVTLKTNDGKEFSFVAGDDVKNLAQVKKGDVVTATYVEAIAYEVKKGGTTAGAATTAVAGRAPLGAKPAGAVAAQVTATVKITAIDPNVPSVTVIGPQGNSRTIKVKDPSKLQGVSVGDTVQLTYTEALAIKVEEAIKK